MPLAAVRRWAAAQAASSRGLSFLNLVDLFVERYSKFGASRRRAERDRDGVPTRLFPFTRNALGGAPRLIVIDPEVGFGRPVIAGTGVVTDEVAARFKAGDSMSDLARDYGRPREEIEEAIRCGLRVP